MTLTAYYHLIWGYYRLEQLTFLGGGLSRLLFVLFVLFFVKTKKGKRNTINLTFGIVEIFPFRPILSVCLSARNNIFRSQEKLAGGRSSRVVSRVVLLHSDTCIFCHAWGEHLKKLNYKVFCCRICESFFLRTSRKFQIVWVTSSSSARARAT